MAERLRLLLTTDAIGGVWTYSLELAAALSRQADMIVILATLGPQPTPEQTIRALSIPGVQLAETDLPLDWLAEDRMALVDASEQLADMAMRAEADLVQLHTPTYAIAEFPVPVISVMHSCVATWWAAVGHGALPDDFMWRAQLMREGLRRSDLAVAPTAAFADAIQQAYALARPPMSVHNGRTWAKRSAMPIEDAVVTIGRLWDDAKNIAVVDAAAARLTVPVRAIGPTKGPNCVSIQLHHADTIDELSHEEVAEALAGRPIFISPAIYEPFGLSVLEAAQAGCALVLSDIGSFRELWNGCALFANPRDENGFVDHVRQLLANPGQRMRLGDAARQRARSYTPDATAGTMLRCYRSLLGQRARVAA